MKHNGTGQLQFVSVSPAGTGRKIYLPFYLLEYWESFHFIIESKISRM